MTRLEKLAHEMLADERLYASGRWWKHRECFCAFPTSSPTFRSDLGLSLCDACAVERRAFGSAQPDPKTCICDRHLAMRLYGPRSLDIDFTKGPSQKLDGPGPFEIDGREWTRANGPVDAEVIEGKGLFMSPVVSGTGVDHDAAMSMAMLWGFMAGRRR